MARRKRLTPPTPLPDAAESQGGQGASASQAPQMNTLERSSLSAASMAPVARVAQDQAQSAALSELSEEMIRAREGGRMVLELPLEAVEAEHLIRDRLGADDAEMESLKESLAASGQRTPIEVLDLGSGNYGLISGWRRLAALRALAEEGRGGDTVLALLRKPEDQAAAYRAMVEENEIRSDLSYYERARIVWKAMEAGIFGSEREALQGLFGAASRARRSKIGSFLPIVRSLDGALQYPSVLPERLGLKLAQRLREDDGLPVKLRTALEEKAETPEAERELLEEAVTAPLRSAAKRKGKASALKGQGAKQVSLECDAKGRVILEGAGVTDDFIEQLKCWLKEQTA